MGKLKTGLLARIIIGLYWLISRTFRYQHIHRPQGGASKPYIYAHWHGDELLLVGAYTGTRMAIMASRSRDGNLMKKVLSGLGYRVTRGSSTRGGAGGLKGLIDAVKGGWSASLAVDGPRGPLYRVKLGVLKLAQQTGTPLVPGAAACSRRYVFKKAWNQCYLPLPFSRCVIVYGDPIVVPANLTDAELEAFRVGVENRLLQLKREAESRFSRKFSMNLVEDGV